MENLNVVKWWVDSSYAAHNIIHRHTGATMSVVCRSVLSMSKKQKINTKRSTEAEIIGADGALPQMLWTKYFIEAQGYGIDENIMYQDNLIAMLLKKNRNNSSKKNTKHIRVRYFFVKDRIATGNVGLKHCPTTKMLADHFTNPLQGELFRKFSAELMNISEETNMADMGRDGTEEKNRFMVSVQ